MATRIKKAEKEKDKLTRIAIVNNDRCRPRKCRQECKSYCPVVRMGKYTSTIRPTRASILYKSIAGRYRPVSYPDGPITARYRFIKNAYWDPKSSDGIVRVNKSNLPACTGR